MRRNPIYGNGTPSGQVESMQRSTRECTGRLHMCDGWDVNLNVVLARMSRAMAYIQPKRKCIEQLLDLGIRLVVDLKP